MASEAVSDVVILAKKESAKKGYTVVSENLSLKVLFLYLCCIFEGFYVLCRILHGITVNHLGNF